MVQNVKGFAGSPLGKGIIKNAENVVKGIVKAAPVVEGAIAEAAPVVGETALALAPVGLKGRDVGGKVWVA